MTVPLRDTEKGGSGQRKLEVSGAFGAIAVV